MGDRARRPGEDPVDWGVETGRIRAASKSKYRGVSAAIIQSLPAGLVQLVDSYKLTGATRNSPVDAAAVSRPPTGLAAWDPNPLVSAARQRDPVAAVAAGARSPAPTLFSAGDLPPFTASGVDPKVLLQVPWQARHPIASEPSQATAYAMLQDYTGHEAEAAAAVDFAGSAENQEYQLRAQNWLAAGMTDDEVMQSLGMD